jgi:erythromycin esterase-like protein
MRPHLKEQHMARTMTAPAPGHLGSLTTPLTGATNDYDPLLELIGDARIVLLGEASHGTHEFYRERARITRRLISERGFTVVAVEADWPDAYRVNRWVRGLGQDGSPIEALDGFTRFPRWMWRNRDVLEFITWLREHNDPIGRAEDRVGFYGLDLYSLFRSIEEVLRFLREVDPEAARRALSRYSCFDHYAEDTQAYGYAAGFGLTPSCETQAVQQLMELQERAHELAQRDGRVPEDELFYAEQNARLVKNAEEYYRTMFQGRVSSWNIRDRHMAETLDALVQYFDRKGRRTKVVVWEHNSHIGDARATAMGREGEWNVGQLAREHYGQEAVLVGFSTYGGTVTAADNWEEPPERKRVRPALAESYEALFHALAVPDFFLALRQGAASEALPRTRLERAIGVVYRPRTERQSHYFEADLSDQFDAVLHFDETTAVEPLDRTPGWHSPEPPETYPTGV